MRYAKYGAVAWEFLGSIAAGVFVGYQLDAYLGSEPWCLTFMTLAGVAVGFYRMIQILRRLQQQT